MQTWEAGRGAGARTWLLAGAAALALGAVAVMSGGAGAGRSGAGLQYDAASGSSGGETSLPAGRNGAGGGSGAGSVTEPGDEAKPPRGIRPPWREHAIPELRSQPGKRQRTYTS